VQGTSVAAQSAEGAACKPAKILITGASGFTGGPAFEILTERTPSMPAWQKACAAALFRLISGFGSHLPAFP
jgi:hypothetical protein